MAFWVARVPVRPFRLQTKVKLRSESRRPGELTWVRRFSVVFNEEKLPVEDLFHETRTGSTRPSSWLSRLGDSG